jgi:hypothetical protein
MLWRLKVICTPCASKRQDCRLLNSFSGLALCRHPTGICRAIGSEHFGACNARNPAGLAVMHVVGSRARALGWKPKYTAEDVHASIVPEVEYMLGQK